MTPANLLICKMLLIRRLCKEVIIFVKILETDTKNEGLFLAIQQFFKEKYVMLENISCSSSKVGKYKGLLAITSRVFRKLTNLLTIHCVINGQQLVAKNICEKKLNLIPLIYDFLNNSAKKMLKNVNGYFCNA